MDYEKIVADAKEYGYLIEACAGCGRPYEQIEGVVSCKDCPCGSTLIWHPHINILKDKSDLLAKVSKIKELANKL